MSDYLENEILDHTLGTGSYTMPSNVYAALFTSDPTDAGTGTELSGDGYARQAITFGAASGGSASNTNSPTFTASGGSWGTITHFGLYDSVSGGNLLYHGSLTSSKTVADGESVVFTTGNLTVTAA